MLSTAIGEEVKLSNCDCRDGEEGEEREEREEEEGSERVVHKFVKAIPQAADCMLSVK